MYDIAFFEIEKKKLLSYIISNDNDQSIHSQSINYCYDQSFYTALFIKLTGLNLIDSKIKM